MWGRADLIIKVKEPLPDEWPLMRPGQTLFTYFHFAADEKLTRAVMASGVTAVAYETIRDTKGGLPLLTPMSEVAGRMSIQEGAKFLERPFEGRGILLAGVPGVAPATVVVLGGGVVGANAARVAAGLGANVFLLDVNLDRLRYLDDVMPRNVTTLFSNRHNLLELLPWADLVIGASRPTTHAKPTYMVDDIVHYCVTNMPGAVGRTSTYALTNATFPFALQLANKGADRAAADNLGLAAGVNVRAGKVTNAAVAETFGLPLEPL